MRTRSLKPGPLVAVVVVVVLVLVVIGIVFQRVEMFVDFALAYALLNFTGSVAASRYLHRASQKRGRNRREREAGERA